MRGYNNEIKFINRQIMFEDCGLSCKNNILQAPICECGCGGYCSIILDTNKELYDFMAEMLSEVDCNHCAIFVIHKDGKTVTVADNSIGDQISIISFCDKETDALAIDLIKEWQNRFKFHCYGLLEENQDRQSYRIIME